MAQEFVINGAKTFYNDMTTYTFFTHSSTSIAIQPGYPCSIQAEKSGFTLVKISELFFAAFGVKSQGIKL